MSGRPTPVADPDTAIEAAIAALKTAEPDSALPAIDAAVARSPDDARLWHLKGLIHREQDRRELAIPALQQAVQLAPRDPLIAHGLARTLFEAGLPSVDAYSHALTVAPGDLDMIKGLASALSAAGRTNDAVRGMAKAVSGAPQWSDGHALLSDLRWLQGEREGFARSFDEALSLHPRSLELRRLQIITLLNAEQYDAVLQAIAHGRQTIGDSDMFDANEAIVAAERGETARADLLFAPFAGLPDASVQIRRVRHLLRCGRPDAASQLIDEWLLSPQGWKFWPYASIAWRMTSDPRWEWLEADPRLVGVYDIADRLPAAGLLAETLRKLHTTRGQPLAQSVRGGTQTDGNLFQQIDPVIVELREAVRSVVADHARQFPPPDPAHPTLACARSPIRFSGSWSVRLKASGFHSNHVHPMGWLSSALYIRLPQDLGKDNAGWLTLGDPSAPSMPLHLDPLLMVEPKEARLVLFPSWMWHGTLPFGDGERLTVAFDVAMPQQS